MIGGGCGVRKININTLFRNYHSFSFNEIAYGLIYTKTALLLWCYANGESTIAFADAASPEVRKKTERKIMKRYLLKSMSSRP